VTRGVTESSAAAPGMRPADRHCAEPDGRNHRQGRKNSIRAAQRSILRSRARCSRSAPVAKANPAALTGACAFAQGSLIASTHSRLVEYCRLIAVVGVAHSKLSPNVQGRKERLAETARR
jgi:hypothetical protein